MSSSVHYEITVITNAYAGNFERLMSAYLFGACSEYMRDEDAVLADFDLEGRKGLEWADPEVADSLQMQTDGDHGYDWQGIEGNNVIYIVQHHEVTKQDLELIKLRAKGFPDACIALGVNEWVGAGFRVVDVEAKKVVTEVTKTAI